MLLSVLTFLHLRQRQSIVRHWTRARPLPQCLPPRHASTDRTTPAPSPRQATGFLREGPQRLRLPQASGRRAAGQRLRGRPHIHREGALNNSFRRLNLKHEYFSLTKTLPSLCTSLTTMCLGFTSRVNRVLCLENVSVIIKSSLSLSNDNFSPVSNPSWERIPESEDCSTAWASTARA